MNDLSTIGAVLENVPLYSKEKGPKPSYADPESVPLVLAFGVEEILHPWESREPAFAAADADQSISEISGNSAQPGAFDSAVIRLLFHEGG
jgi:hypothetical protein